MNGEHETRLAQTFTFDLTGTLYEVRLKIGGSYALELLEVTADGMPSGTRRAYLTRSSNSAGSSTTAPADEASFAGFVASEPVRVSPGDRLAVVVSGWVGTGRVWGASSDVYAGGTVLQMNDMAPWQALNKDFDFQLLVGP